MNVNDWLERGGYVFSSGTTGEPKQVYQPPQKLKALCRVATATQCITSESRILTVCKMDHAGGALAQTLPALSLGAHVDIEAFNAYTFADRVKGYTHTHLAPGHIELLSKTRGFLNARYDGLWVTCGSDRVEWWMIEYFVERGATFMCNWGMSEVGPIAINATFNNMEKVDLYRELTPERCNIMGDDVVCDVKIKPDGELVVWGELCVYGGEFNTGDLVELHNGVWFYKGRK